MKILAPLLLMFTLVTANAAIPVEVTQVKTATIPKQVYALGSLMAPKSVTISSEVDGRVAKIYFQDGQDVGQGMPIIQLDNTKDKANYQSALAALNLSRNKYHRAQKLFPEGAISKQDLEQLKADVESKEADVKTSLATLNQKELTAPFSGTLGAFKTNEGDFINKGDAIVTLVNNTQLKVEYSLPEALRSLLKLGQQVTVTTRAYPDNKFYGTVTFISPTVDLKTRSIAIQAETSNDKELLTTGMFVNVAQNIKVIKNALVIPEQSITADLKGYTVDVVTNKKVKEIRVKIGLRFNGNVQILQGLKEGDNVVTAGQQKVSDGDSVKIINQDQNLATS